MMNHMIRMRFTGPLSLGQLLWGLMATLCSTQDITIFPSRGNITIPSLSFDLMPRVPLVCGLKPETLAPRVNYTTRWILPGGREIVNASRGRFVFSESQVSINNRDLPGTVLKVTQLSYQDAGTYTCEGRSTASGVSTTQWATASFELQLNLDLLSNTSAINATMNDSTIVLHCEMRAFIRPDSSLLWKGPSGRRIASDENKYHITFSDGVPDVAANGSQTLVPSRVSTLTIINPEPSDSGRYTCSIVGVSAEVVISVQVDGFSSIHGSIIDTTQPSVTANSSDSSSIIDTTQPSVTASSSDSSSTLTLIGIILGSLSAVILSVAGILATVVCCVIQMQNKSRKVLNHDLNKKVQPTYDYVDLPRLDHGSHLVRYSRQPDIKTVHNNQLLNQTAYDDIVINDDRNAAIYDEIKDNNERDDTYDVVMDAQYFSTTRDVKCKAVTSDCNDYEVPVSGTGTLVVESNVQNVAGTVTNGTDHEECTKHDENNERC